MATKRSIAMCATAQENYTCALGKWCSGCCWHLEWGCSASVCSDYVLLWICVLCLLLLWMAGTSCTTLSLKSERPVFWQLTPSPEPHVCELWDQAPKLPFTLLSQQWHRESVTWETWRNFPLVPRSPPVRQSESFWDISGWLRGSFSTVLE